MKSLYLGVGFLMAGLIIIASVISSFDLTLNELANILAKDGGGITTVARIGFILAGVGSLLSFYWMMFGGKSK
ncbi:hypothetical protein GUP52_004801 [Salmonella enterica]|nr:hypothetical protein [Salmonella enterica]